VIRGLAQQIGLAAVIQRHRGILETTVVLNSKVVSAEPLVCGLPASEAICSRGCFKTTQTAKQWGTVKQGAYVCCDAVGPASCEACASPGQPDESGPAAVVWTG
jgi:hypothetical protein